MATTLNPSAPHVLIIGSGISGLALAQALRKKGVSFEVFERDTTEYSRSQGWAIGLHTMLDDLKASLPDGMEPIETTRHLQPLNLPSEAAYYGKGGVKTGVRDDGSYTVLRAHRWRLRKWLGTNIRIQYGKQAVRIEDDDKSVTVHFADGTLATGDILVGAEGGNSATRAHILKGEDPMQIQPIAAVVGETVLENDAFERALQVGHSICVTNVELDDGGEARWAVGLNEVLPDCRSAKYFWLFAWRDKDAAKPDHWTRTESQEDIYRKADGMLKRLNPRMREVFERTKPEGITRAWTFRDLELSSMPTSRITLVGDAAHCMTPFRGEGGTHAITDSLHLARTLAGLDKNDYEQIREVMGRYQDEMLARGSKAVKLSRGSFGSEPESGPRMVWGHVVKPLPDFKICLDDIIPSK